ncbi:DNA repair helicase RAD25 [Sporothrix eucalyptigena]|uniref:DNA repair helicase RAD25 n=1 Tax=Sporothrix eucalyptigena TaxID=1812306 RepID=A0ABP0ALL7_9PEZI
MPVKRKAPPGSSAQASALKSGKASSASTPEPGTKAHSSFHPLANLAQDFLITIAELISRPAFMHQYHLTTHSLYAAVSVGLNPHDIIKTLNRFLKTDVPEVIHDFIFSITDSFGKKLLKDTVIGPLRVHEGAGISMTVAPSIHGLAISGTQNAGGVHQAKGLGNNNTKGNGGGAEEPRPIAREEHANDGKEAVDSVEVADHGIEIVQKKCRLELGYPVLEGFGNVEVNANLEIDLRPNAPAVPGEDSQ